jgi:hypothetical protein
MKRILVIVCMLFVSLSAFGQAINPAGIDLSKAEMAIAGPNSIYVTNINYNGTILSVLLKYDGATGAIIYGPWFASDKLLQDNYELGYATINKLGTDSLVVSNVVVGSAAYTGRFKFDGVSKINLENYWTTTMPMTAEARIAALEGRLAAKEKLYKAEMAAKEKMYSDNLAAAELISDAEAEKLQADLDAAIMAARAAGVAPEKIAAMISKPGRIAASGFTGGRAVAGSWSVTSSGASQTDASAYFAKYAIPVSQASNETLYTIKAKADESGFVGYGLHFFASGDRRSDGYGYGTSYLVWLTRDPAYYGTDTTYLQAYGSFDDGEMIQAASMGIAAPIGMTNTTEVIYNKANGSVSVSVNGTEYISFTIPAEYRLGSGSKIALRALGKVTFSDLTVKTK